MIHCLFYCHVPVKEHSSHLMSLHQETLCFVLTTEKVAFVSGFYGLLLFVYLFIFRKGRELERFSQGVFEVLTFSLVLLSSSSSSSTAFSYFWSGASFHFLD